MIIMYSINLIINGTNYIVSISESMKSVNKETNKKVNKTEGKCWR